MYSNIKYLFFLVITLYSCNDFLDEKPQTDFTQEGTGIEDKVSKYKTIADAQAELSGVYDCFKYDIFQFENYCIGDVQSDNCYIGGDGVAEQQFELVSFTSTNSKVALIWQDYYKMAGGATMVIENAKLMTDCDERERGRIIAEAKFIRAWAYFDIVRIWGKAPMVLDLIPTITAENIKEWYPVIYPKCASGEEIYAQILSDLDDETISFLLSKSKGAFQATKGAAYGLKAKVFATIGKKNDRDYNKVKEYCDKVVSEGYTIVNNFDDLWNPDNKFTTESIFEVYYTAEAPNWSYWVLLKEDDGSVTWNRYCTPTKELVAKFDKENDVRFKSSILWRAVPYNTYWPADNYPLSYKIREKSSDIILMRFADIMLLKAEALIELGNIKEAVIIINDIRRRAGLGSSLIDENINQEKARKVVLDERQLELYMEGQRWFDLKRNNLFIEVMKEQKDVNGKYIYKDIQEFRNIWPLPQTEIDKNNNLIQNIGY